MCEHFGHMITETLNRLWWFVENPGSGYKAAFINWFGNSEKVQFPEFLQMLGLDETDIIIVNEPTRFEAVIVPDQASYLHSGYTNKCIDVYNAIRGSVKPAGYDRVYLTKTKLVPKYLLGEEYFEDYYRSLGFEIVAPETLPIKEQVAIMAGAKEIVTTSGTTQHLILFCQDGVKLTLLNRSPQFIQQQHWIIQARAARCTFIDIFADLLPPAWYSAPHIFFPTEHWKRYLKENGMPFKDCGITVRDYIMEYLMSWISEIPKFPLHFIKHYRYYTLADMIISFHRYLCEEELEASVQEKLRAVFPRPK